MSLGCLASIRLQSYIHLLFAVVWLQVALAGLVVLRLQLVYNCLQPSQKSQMLSIASSIVGILVQGI